MMAEPVVENICACQYAYAFNSETIQIFAVDLRNFSSANNYNVFFLPQKPGKYFFCHTFLLARSNRNLRFITSKGSLLDSCL